MDIGHITCHGCVTKRCQACLAPKRLSRRCEVPALGATQMQVDRSHVVETAGWQGAWKGWKSQGISELTLRKFKQRKAMTF